MLTIGAFEKAKIYISSHSTPTENIQRKKTGFCITISRETGAGADIISKKLLNILQNKRIENSPEVTIFDRNIIEKVLQDYDLPRSLSQYMKEQKYSAFSSIAAELISGPNIWDLVRKTSNTIYQLAQLGNVIIIGRAANIITSKLRNTFHVRLIAPLEKRIKHIEDIYQLTRFEAEEFIRRNDIARKNYVKTYFNKNNDDPLLYHLILNTGLLSFDEASEIIVNRVMKKFPHIFSITRQLEF